MEAMLISRSWEKAVREASTLWRKVTVYREWDAIGDGGGRGNEHKNMLSRALGVAKEVSLAHIFRQDSRLAMSLETMFGVNLRSLELPGSCIYPSSFMLLQSRCPQLESLMVKNEPNGNGGIQISHLNLKTLLFRGLKARPLTVRCPNLAVLRISGSIGDGTHVTHSLHCSLLTNLALSPLHGSGSDLEAMASHAPNINSLEVTCRNEECLRSLRAFRSLTFLSLVDILEYLPADYSWWPDLEVLELTGTKILSSLLVLHAGLKSLVVNNWESVFHPLLSCPALERLKLEGHILGKRSLWGLNTLCPRLSELHLKRLWPSKMWDPLELNHEKLETLTLETESESLWDDHDLTCSKVECPSLTKLQVVGSFSISNLHSILAWLPSLKIPKLSGVFMGWSSVVLEHPHVQNFVMEKSSMRELSLIMTSLVNASIVESTIWVLQVTHKRMCSWSTPMLVRGDA